MKKLQWNMEEVFYFPENVGVPKDARLVKVKAGFTEKRTEDAVRLVRYLPYCREGRLYRRAT